MDNLIQVTYTSRALFPLSDNPHLIEPEVADILQKSRANNRGRRLVGVLCFGDGCFLQCLQGEDNTIQKLLEVIKQDPRHEDLTVLNKVSIDKKTFSRWSMKHVGISSEMRSILSSSGISKFNPYQFDGTILQKIISYLESSSP